MSKHVELDLPDLVFDRLRELATIQGGTVTGILTRQAVALAQATTRPRRVLIAELHAQGLTTAQIARELALTNAQVSAHYRPLGVTANPTPPAPPRERSPRAHRLHT